MNASEFDEIYLEGFKACYNAICLHIPLESLQDAGWQEFVDTKLMIEARKRIQNDNVQNLLKDFNSVKISGGKASDDESYNQS